MKKIIALSAVTAMLCVAMGAQSASQAKLTVTDGDKREVSFVNDTTDMASKSVKNVLYTLSDLNARNSSIKQAFEVTSEAEEGAVDVFLRLFTESSTTTALNDATELLSTYEIVVKNNADEVIFDSEEDGIAVKELNKADFAVDIFLGRFNEDELNEVNTYNLSVTVPSDKTASEIRKAKDIEWEIVSDPVEADSTPVPVKEEEPTAVPTAEPTLTPAPVATAAPTEVPAETPEETEAPIEAISSGERMIGDGDGEIKAGKYLAEARDKTAIIRIYDEDGELSREIELDEETPSKVITLKDGQKLTYEGGVNLTPYKSTATAGTASQTGTASNKTTNKTNPKTGDAAPIAGVAMTGVFALGMLAYPEIEKRRNK